MHSYALTNRDLRESYLKSKILREGEKVEYDKHAYPNNVRSLG
jgi:hypothetical protein